MIPCQTFCCQVMLNCGMESESLTFKFSQWMVLVRLNAKQSESKELL